MIDMIEEIFNKIILTYKIIKKRFRLCNMFCKKCGHTMNYDYTVSDEDWSKLPSEYGVLCWNCFCDEYPNDVSEVKVQFCGGKKFLEDFKIDDLFNGDVE